MPVYISIERNELADETLDFAEIVERASSKSIGTDDDGPPADPATDTLSDSTFAWPKIWLATSSPTIDLTSASFSAKLENNLVIKRKIKKPWWNGQLFIHVTVVDIIKTGWFVVRLK